MSEVASTRALLSGGMVGPVVFVAVFTILGAISPGYDPMRQFVSLLSLSEAGLVQTVSFLVTGVLIISAAFGLRRASAPGRGSRWAPIGIFLAGLGFIVAGLFPTDALQGYPPGTPLGLPLTASAHAAVHVSGALLFFVGPPVASIVMARRLASAGEPGWAAYSAASGVGMLLFNAATSASRGTVGMFSDVAGLLQRISIVIGLAWLAAVSLRMIRELSVATKATCR